MFKKHKQLITGFILGAIVFGTMPVQAKVQEYLLQKSTAKVMVDGKEFANKDLPVLNYKNSNYIPMATFREICDNIGVGFEWVGESSEVRISTGKSEVVKPIEKVIQPIEERKGESMTEIEKDKYELVVVDGVEYVNIKDIYEKHGRKYNFDRAEDSSIENRHLVFINEKTNKQLLDITHDQNYIFNNRTYVMYDYYLNTILPIIRADGN